MTDLLSFDFNTSAVRVVPRDDGPWWIAADVARILGYNHAPHMVRNLDDDEKGVHIVDTLGGPQSLSIISESGLYNAIFRSRRDEARSFRRWVTGEVLPALRRHGRYDCAAAAAAPSFDPVFLNAAVAAVRESRRLFGPGIARAVWAGFGLPMPDAPSDALPDGLAQAVAVWAQAQDRFTNRELAAGIGLGSVDQATKLRLAAILPALGFACKRFRRGRALLYGWVRVQQQGGE